jgi:Tol biopolymer transport system component
LVYTMAKETQGQIFLRDTSGQVEPKLLYTARGQVELTDWSVDGRWIFFNHINPDNGGSEIWQLDMQDQQGTLLLAGHWYERGSLSPDGRWLAFTSDESGSVEAYVQSYPEPTGRWRVSNDPGAGNVARPRWRKDGRELFYLRGGSVVVVPVKEAATFSFGEPTVLFSVSVTAASSDINISGDGQRILTNDLPPTNQNKIGARLIQNWLGVIDR